MHTVDTGIRSGGNPRPFGFDEGFNKWEEVLLITNVCTYMYSELGVNGPEEYTCSLHRYMYIHDIHVPVHVGLFHDIYMNVCTSTAVHTVHTGTYMCTYIHATFTQR